MGELFTGVRGKDDLLWYILEVPNNQGYIREEVKWIIAEWRGN
jgi:hypothetical protein